MDVGCGTARRALRRRRRLARQPCKVKRPGSSSASVASCRGPTFLGPSVVAVGFQVALGGMAAMGPNSASRRSTASKCSIVQHRLLQESSWFACDGCDRKLACIQEVNCIFGHEEAGTLGSSTSSGFRESFNSKRLIGRQSPQPGRQHPASKTGDGRAYPAYRASSCAHIEGSVFYSLRRIQAQETCNFALIWLLQ